MFTLFVSLWVSSRGFLVVFEALGLEMCTFGVLGLSRETRAPPFGAPPLGAPKVVYVVLAKFGLAKVGQIRMVKAGLAIVGISLLSALILYQLHC